MTDPLSSVRVLMIHPSHELVRKAALAGCRVWAVWDPALRDAAYLSEVARYAEGLLLVDTKDEDALRAGITRVARAYRLVHVTHPGGAPAAGPVLALAEELGIAANPAHAVQVLGDRAAMRELLQTHPRLHVAARRAADAAGVVEAAARFAGAPVVVKSAVAGGGCRAELVRRGRAVREWERRAEAGGARGPFLVEEYLPGPQFAVETLSVDGMHQVVGVTAVLTTGAPHFVTTSLLHPAPLAVRDQAAIRSAACALLDLAGFENGPVRTEVVQHPGGVPRILTSRVGFDDADRTPRLVELATGIDLEEESFRALAGALPAPASVHRTAMAGFFPLPDDPSVPPAGLAGLSALPYVRAVEPPVWAAGSGPGGAGTLTRRGCVAVVGAGPQEAAGYLALAREHLAAYTGAHFPTGPYAKADGRHRAGPRP